VVHVHTQATIFLCCETIRTASLISFRNQRA
jgi:hypothetical protein